MSSRAPNWFEQKYIKGVTHALQGEGFVTRGMFQSEASIKGNIVNWKVAGKGQATPMSTAIEERPIMNADRQMIPGTMADYEANEWILTTDIEKMSENEQQISQKTGAMAIGRTFDQVPLRAIDAAAPTVIGNGTAAISPVDIINGQSQIGGQGLQTSYEWFVALPTIFIAQLMLYREFTSSDWVGDEYPLLKAIGARKWLGMTIFPLPDEYFVSNVANSLDGYMWIKPAVGFATNYELVSRIDYVPTKKAYFAANTIGLCSAVLLPTGIRRMRFATNVALSRPTP